MTLIAFLSVTACATMHLLIKTGEKSAAVINASGRQRMLSQRTALIGLQQAASSDPAERQRLRKELLKTVNLMEEIHDGLLHGSDCLNLPGNPAPPRRGPV